MRENENLMVPAWVTRMRTRKEHILGDKEFGFGNSELEMPIDYTTISSCCSTLLKRELELKRKDDERSSWRKMGIDGMAHVE